MDERISCYARSEIEGIAALFRDISDTAEHEAAVKTAYRINQRLLLVSFVARRAIGEVLIWSAFACRLIQCRAWPISKDKGFIIQQQNSGLN